ncbi:MAG: arsenate reductase [Halobacteriovoraceae bacterium]|nr:arsenate reductase [Halobacteriovoraceae bacterium]|tara:strand:+ start:270602 stop:270940 length:339 start_codon:yes stop_codon:yes gene_type:complete
MYKVYGIPNCNTVKKALNHLNDSGIEYEFVNFKKTPPTKTQIQSWKKSFGDWPVNKKGPTYRKIKEEFEAASAPEKKEILTQTTSAIKRPIVEKDGEVMVFGYDQEKYAEMF